MKISSAAQRMIVRSLMIATLLLSAGCSLIAPQPPKPVETVTLPPQPTPAPAPVPEPEPDPQPPPEPIAEPEPAIPPTEVPVEPDSIGPMVAIVIADRSPAYVSVAESLRQYLDHFEVYDLSDHSMPSSAAFEAIANSDAKAVVAVGLPAARAAHQFATVPVVIGQVFNLNQSNLISDTVKAVGVLPPMELQIDAWLEIDPELKSVGAILGPGHDDLVAEADEAMSERGIKFHHVIAESDRQTAYLFNRLVRDLDGFILFPDNRILSRPVLAEIMSNADRHRVQVAVFNEPLLQLGAAFSTAAAPTDVAATITVVLNEILSGNLSDVSPVTPLSTFDLKTNANVLQKLGLSLVIENTIAGTK